MSAQNSQRDRPQGSQTQVQAEAPTGSRTQTGTQAPASTAPAILRLRGAHPASDHRVQWAESVVDNEGLGRKRSKGNFISLILTLPLSARSREFQFF